MRKVNPIFADDANMTKIILIRHGETDWNRDKIYRGRIDIELNERGIEQASTLGETLKDVELEAIYSSPLKRAYKTAQIIARSHKLEVESEEGFIDFDYGKWIGLSQDEVRARFPDLYKRWRFEPSIVKIPEGESLDSVAERGIVALKDISAKHQGGIVAIVSHRVVNKVLLCAILDLDNSHFWNIKQDNCAMNIFEYSKDENPIVHLINDTCHLRRIRDIFITADF